MDLNIDLDAVARRLSFSAATPSPSPRPSQHGRFRVTPALSPIAEDPREQQQAAAAAQAPPPPPPWASSSPWFPPSSPAPHTVTHQMPVMSSPAVAPSHIVPAPPSPPSVTSPRPQQSLAEALEELERMRRAGLEQALVAEYQLKALATAFVERGEQARQAALQQAWAKLKPQPQPQQLRLYTVEGNTAGYKTKWGELHPVSQELLLQIEEKIGENRHASEQLDQCSRLYDRSLSYRGFELDSSQIAQDIGSISTIIEREKAYIRSLNAVVEEVMCYTELAHSLFVKLRPWFLKRGAGIANAGFANPAGSLGASADNNHPLTLAPTMHSYRGFVRRPSFFMQHIVDRFEKKVEECRKYIEDLEEIIEMKNDKSCSASLESLPKVMSNTHDYFIHVAAKVESLHQYAETMRTQSLNDQRNRGSCNAPFLEANRKEAAKQESAARIVHPKMPKMVATQNRRQMNQFQINHLSFWRSDHESLGGGNHARHL